MVNLLRRALRLLAEQQLGRDLQGLGYAVANRRPSVRSRVVGDAPLPGLGPETDEPGLFDEQ